jgi:outer membrane lipoprotein-sorting protein
MTLRCVVDPRPQENVEKARKLIEEAAAKLKGAATIGFEQENTSGEAGSTDARVPIRSKVWVRLPDKMRWESSGSSGVWLQLFDGKTMWNFEHSKGEYTKNPQYRGTIKTRSYDNPLVRFYVETDPAKLLEKATDVVVDRRKEGDAVFDVISWRVKDPYGRGTGTITDHSLWLDASRLPRRFTKRTEWQGRLTEHR